MDKANEKSLSERLSAQAGERFSGSAADIERIASSGDGKKVQKLLEDGGFDLAGALERGDTKALGDALKSIMSTSEGSRVVSRLKGMIK